MKHRAVLILSVMAMAAAQVASAQNFSRLGANLIGFNEVPSVSSVASGQFDAVINDDDSEIAYTLSYSDLEGNVTQAHIHFGQRDVNGGITVFLCTNLGNGPAGTQACPASPATITGTITAADVSPVINPANPGADATAAARAQGIGAGEFAELVRAIRAGVTYVNVHSTKFGGGEMRNQLGTGQTGGGHSH
jgi:hypothetical protein